MTILLGPPDTAVPDVERPSGRLALAGLVAAAWSATIGLALLTIIAIVTWIAAPHGPVAGGIPGVLRAAVQMWLVAHHAGFTLLDGATQIRVGLLPLGLIAAPGLLLLRSGEWLGRVGGVTRLRHVVPAALTLAAPYALLSAGLATLARTDLVRPSTSQALVGCFLVASLAGGVGVLRALGWRRVLPLLSPRVRSLLAGVGGGVAVLVVCGSLLVGISLAVHLQRAQALAEALAPGIVGGVLLVGVQIVFVPNAILWGISYAVGPGFAIGAGTSVALDGVRLGELPTLPLLAALPEPGPAPAVSFAAIAAPLLAGVVAGVLTIRVLPTLNSESAALWGLVSGGGAGLVVGLLAALSGGPIGGGRLVTVGPSGWQVAAVGVLEVGVTAAIAAWVANRRAGRPVKRPGRPLLRVITGLGQRD